MSDIKSKDFSFTLGALLQFNELQRLDPSKRDGLPRLKRDGNRLILTNAVAMSRFDKVLSVFGLGGYRLKNVVNFLQSEGFCKQLLNTPLDVQKRSNLEGALSTLDRKISKHNSRHNSLTLIILGFRIHIPFYTVRIFRPEITLKHKRLSHIVSTYVVDANRNEYVAHHKAPQKLKMHIPAGNKLLADIQSGKVLIRDASSCSDQISSFELHRAYVFQERLKLQHMISQPDTDLFSMAFCRYSTEKPLHTMLPKLFEQMNASLDLKDEELQKFSFEELKQHLFIRKLQPWLDFFEISHESRNEIQQAFLLLKKQNFHVNDLIDKHFIALKDLNSNTTIPPLALQSMVKAIREELYYTVHEWASTDLSLWLNDLAIRKISGSDFEKNIAGFITSLQTGGVDADFNFVLKWAPYLVKEMVQGGLEASDALIGGVCWAISKRWTRQQRDFFDLPNQVLLQKMNFGTIEPQDRYKQAQYILEPNKDKAIYETKHLEGKPAIQQAIQKMLDHAEWQNIHKGIGHLSIRYRAGLKKDGSDTIAVEDGHSIAITAYKDSLHPERSLFRILDSNYGAYDFPVQPGGADKAEALFIDCLSDLISKHSQSIKSLLIYPPK